MNYWCLFLICTFFCREDILDEILDLARTGLVAIAPTGTWCNPENLQETYNNFKVIKTLSKFIGKYQK